MTVIVATRVFVVVFVCMMSFERLLTPLNVDDFTMLELTGRRTLQWEPRYMYFAFTRMPGENYRTEATQLFVVVFVRRLSNQALINSLFF